MWEVMLLNNATGEKFNKTFTSEYLYQKFLNKAKRSKKITVDKKKSVFENYIAGTIKEYIRQIVDETEVENKLTEAREAFGIK